MQKDTFIDKSGKIRKCIMVECPVCHQLFKTRKDQPHTFCSKQCKNKQQALNYADNRTQLKCAWCHKRFTRTNSKISDSKSGLHFCSRQCKDEAQKLGGITEIMPSHYGTSSEPEYRSQFIEGELVCARCGYDEFICSVAIHHIDEDRSNRNRDNLIPLCHNCHHGLHNKKWVLSDLHIMSMW